MTVTPDASRDVPPGRPTSALDTTPGTGGLLRGDPVDLAGVLTLLMLLLYAGRYWYIEVPMTALAVVGLIRCDWLRRPWFWFIVTMFVASTNYMHRLTIDNHKYLMTWWCLAFWLATLLPRHVQHRALRTSAALLIGLAMGFSVLWKLITDDYITGAFFQYTLLTDDRFEYFANWVAGVPMQVLAANDQVEADIDDHIQFAETARTVMLQGVDAIRPLATFMTWWTIGIESIVAILFLVPGRRRLLLWLRNASLLGFIVTTYSVATVSGFAWLLIVMGVAQCPPSWRRARLLYCSALILVIIYRTRFGDVSTFLLPSGEG